MIDKKVLQSDLPSIRWLTLALAVATLLLPVRLAVADAAIASAHPLATAAGHEILSKGGNAFDAAVAVSAALAVVEPAGSGIGGGGFWLLYRATDKIEIMLDGREKAPYAAKRDMFQDANGLPSPGLSVNGALSAGIPGEPAALAWLAQNYGRLPLAVSLDPAIRYARNGFKIDERHTRLLNFRLGVIQQSTAAAKVFLDNGEVPPAGFVLLQADLANTLQILADYGHEGFYAGTLAKKLVDGVRKAGGIWTHKDLQDYSVVVRKPIKSSYRRMKISSAALPSSGGIVMSEILNILEPLDLDDLQLSQRIHLISEAMRRAYRDRAQYLGDGDFVDVPVRRLISNDYAAGLRQSIRLDRAGDSSSLAPTHVDKSSGENTTHFSIIDHEGNRVAATLSINYPFGSGMVVAGTGVLLNDEMDDFSASSGEPNIYELVGGEANAIQAGKRMLSSMTPTFLETDDRIAVIGTPGGSRIISMVMLVALAFERGESAQQIVDRRRFHHQYLPDQILLEPRSFNKRTIGALRQLGHEVVVYSRRWGNMHTVIMDKKSGELSAASDSRGIGSAVVKRRF